MIFQNFSECIYRSSFCLQKVTWLYTFFFSFLWFILLKYDKLAVSWSIMKFLLFIFKEAVYKQFQNQLDIDITWSISWAKNIVGNSNFLTNPESIRKCGIPEKGLKITRQTEVQNCLELGCSALDTHEYILAAFFFW